MACQNGENPKFAFQSSVEDREHINGIPDHGFRVQLDHTFPVKGKPFTVPRWNQIPSFVGLSFRFMKLWNQKRKEGKRTFIDPLHDRVPNIQIYGVPLGGIGSGSIGRGFRGEFCRYQMLPGLYTWHTLDCNQDAPLSSWNWGYPGDQATYHALYPRAWTQYKLPGQYVTLICRQVSPVFPHDYKDTCLPMGLFVWTIINESDEEVEVSITFTFKNGQGMKGENEGADLRSASFTAENPGESCGADPPAEPHTEGAQVNGFGHDWKACGVTLHQILKGMPCTYVLAGKHSDDVNVSHKLNFDPKSDGKDLWSDLLQTGRLNPGEGKLQAKSHEMGVAVCCQRKVKAKSSGDVEMALAWDSPKVQFGKKDKEYLKRYCRWFPSDGTAGPLLAAYGFSKREEWEKKISAWQQPVLENSCLPSWYKSALFNELYFVSDGGTVWLDEAEKTEPPRPITEDIADMGKFGYLEGHEYRMYNTYDVHFYASFALVQLWPKLQLSIQYDIEHAVNRALNTTVRYLMGGKVAPNKQFGAVPHDLGDPEDEPWININSYPVHQTDDWKDLNVKFVLQVFRDYHVTKDIDYLKNMMNSVKLVMDRAEQFDTDKDGVIENGGYADQTYDAWVATGTSAYCGSLWLAAVKSYLSMLSTLDREADTDFEKYTGILRKGQLSFDKKLWNGSYYLYDASNGSYSDSIMSDQLCGHWYLRACGIDDPLIFPPEKVKQALQTIFSHNVCLFGGGVMGAINGCRPSRCKDTSSVQAEEFWTGVIYALAASMIQEGLIGEALQTSYGVYHTCYERRGLGFQTPEAYYEKSHFRATGYMRPLCIWSIQWALKQHQEKLHSGEGPPPEHWDLQGGTPS